MVDIDMAETQFPLALVLPDVPSARDQCVTRLLKAIGRQPGITFGHVADAAGNLCVHFDPAVLSLSQVTRIVRAAGSSLSDQVGHVVLPIRAVLSEDAGSRIEKAVRHLPGVMEAAVSLPAQQLRVEFDRGAVSIDRIRGLVQELGLESPAPPGSGAAPPGVPPSWLRRNRELVWSLCAGLFLIIGWSAQRFGNVTPALVIPMFIVAYGFGAWDLLRHLVIGLRKGHFAFGRRVSIVR